MKGLIDIKLWGGRFTKATNSQANDFHSSVSFDSRLYKQDIKGSVAQAMMLGKCGIIPEGDAEDIVSGLNEILQDIENGKVEFDQNAEDIHMNIETILTQRIGGAGKKLHTGRSRNDQVALDMRMYVKDEITEIKTLILGLAEALNNIAKEHTETAMPGYTHLQRAQPVTLAHHMLAYAEMFKRDIDRLDDAYRRADVCPLGSAALAGTTYPIDREFVARELGFSKITQNSMDAVADRDFLIDLLSALSVLMMHLSRFCEEVIIWASYEFKFIELDDAYATGSSIMPQKKNPDMAELIRGKTGRVYGSLITMLTVMKGLPLTYNKDMQEDKQCVFDAVDTVKTALPVFTNMLLTATFNKENMYKAASGGFTNATDAADYLVKKGMSFREAHEVIGRLVLICIDKNKAIEQLTIDELKDISPVFDNDLYEAIALKNCVNKRDITGGPAEAQVRALIAANGEYIAAFRRHTQGDI